MMMKRFVAALSLLALLIGAAPAPASPATPGATPVAAPTPIQFPRDDGQHADAATEWWYYTGHLTTDAGDLYGFEFVIFHVQRGALTGYVSHFAITDNVRDRQGAAQQVAGEKGVLGDRAALDLNVNGWTMLGENGADTLRAAMDGYAIDLHLEPGKPPALHEGDGFIDYGNGTYSYYYSRTRMPAAGTLSVNGVEQRVTGSAWMDHQWGNFNTFTEGGWDWYALQLDDDSEVMLYVIHDAEGRALRVDGSLIDPEGRLTVLSEGDFSVEAQGTWTSPETGVVWPQGWTIAVPSTGLDLTVTPTMPDQEMDTGFSTGIVYWEGESHVTGMRDGEPVSGMAYVELTGYAPLQEIGALWPDVTPAATPTGGADGAA